MANSPSGACWKELSQENGEAVLRGRQLVTASIFAFRDAADQPNVSRREILWLMYAKGMNATTTSEWTRGQFKLGTEARTDWTNFVREVVAKDLLQRPRMGGEEIQVDESRGRHKANRGRLLAEDGVPGRFNANYGGVEDRGPWVVGLYWVSTGETRLLEVEKRDGDTLKNITAKNVLPKTKVVTDEWRGYNNLELLQDAARDLQHETVCHQDNFVDPTTGAHTQNIEQAWQKCKRLLVRTGGTSRALLESHLHWIRWESMNGEDPFPRLVEAVARQYPQG